MSSAIYSDNSFTSDTIQQIKELKIRCKSVNATKKLCITWKRSTQKDIRGTLQENYVALLDAQKGGFFSIAPTSIADTQCKQLYMPETNILITRFLAIEGVGEITDFMPIKQVGSEEHQHLLIRSVKVVRGTLTFEMVCRPAFNYARDPHTIHMTQNGAIFHSENLSLGLASSVPLEQDSQGGVRAVFTIQEKQSVRFFLQSAREDNPIPNQFTESHYDELAQQTLRYWRNWLSHCHYQGRWRETVQRSALILKLLTYAPTGAIVSDLTFVARMRRSPR